MQSHKSVLNPRRGLLLAGVRGKCTMCLSSPAVSSGLVRMVERVPRTSKGVPNAQVMFKPLSMSYLLMSNRPKEDTGLRLDSA